jgi:flavin-dependent dehydrogenase
MIRVDVLMVGAGPAGAVAALNLAPYRRVLLVDRHSEGASRIGESLAPAARRLFIDMGLWDAFVAEGHAPCHGNVAVWGGSSPVETDFLRDPDGPGWHLDRARFDRWLRREAAARGAKVASPLSVDTVTRDDNHWRVMLKGPGGPLEVRAGALVDAGGRTAPLASRLGAVRRVDDRLACRWLHGRASPTGAGAALTHVFAEPDGWWYTAPLPGGRRVLAFHSDADLLSGVHPRNGAALLQRAAGVLGLGQLLSAGDFVGEGDVRSAAAHSCVLEPAVGDGWAAVGDAALGFDPLSSQGLFNALFTGLAGAEAVHRALDGDRAALTDYAGVLSSIRARYRRHLASYYGEERRFAAHPFWRRRHAM